MSSPVELPPMALSSYKPPPLPRPRPRIQEFADELLLMICAYVQGPPPKLGLDHDPDPHATARRGNRDLINFSYTCHDIYKVADIHLYQSPGIMNLDKFLRSLVANPDRRKAVSHLWDGATVRGDHFAGADGSGRLFAGALQRMEDEGVRRGESRQGQPFTGLDAFWMAAQTLPNVKTAVLKLGRI